MLLSTHIESFLTRSRKVSSTEISGSSGPKRTWRPRGDGVRKGSAPDNGRDLTRNGIPRVSNIPQQEIIQMMFGFPRCSAWGCKLRAKRGNEAHA